MSDILENEQTEVTRITGGDELFTADVIQEDGVNKLHVKSTTVPSTVSTFVFEKFLNGASSDLAVNGTLLAPVVFTVNAPLVFDAVIREIKFTSFDGGMKVDTFLGQNSALTNGVLVRITTNGVVQDFLPIQTTQDFDGHFAWGSGARFELISAAGNDSMVAQFSPLEPLVLKGGTADKIEVLIQDNLNNIAFLEALAFGFLDN